VTIPLLHKVYLDQVHHLYYRTLYPPLSLAFPFLKYYFVGLIMLSSYVRNRPCVSSLVSTSVLSPLPLYPPTYVTQIISLYTHVPLLQS
jgi:hypothetical protein